MNHDEIKDKVFLLRDNELSEAEARAVRAHLAECVECKETLKTWESIAGSLLKERPVAGSEVFVEAVMERVFTTGPADETPEFPDWAWRALSLGAALAAGLLIFVLRLPDTAVSVETLLLASDRGGSVNTVIFASQQPQNDDLMNIMFEKEDL